MELPEPLLRIAPELARASFPSEPYATCSQCAMVARPGVERPAHERAFTATARCCTYHPRLANFLVGRALRRGGIGADRIRARIDRREGVDPHGIAPGPRWERAWRARAAEAFGSDDRFTCPYWVAGGDLGCSIHPDRDAVCRTWHCRVAGGQRGQAAWGAVNVVLSRLELRLARFCVEQLPAPAPRPGEARIDTDGIVAYYVACAERADRLTDADLAWLRSERIATLAGKVAVAIAARDVPLPDVLQPRIRDWVRVPDGVILTSFSPYDPILAPPWIFELLSRLDGVRTWAVAVAETASAIGAEVPDGLIARLWDRGLVGPAEIGEPSEGEAPPFDPTGPTDPYDPVDDGFGIGALTEAPPDTPSAE